MYFLCGLSPGRSTDSHTRSPILAMAMSFPVMLFLGYFNVCLAQENMRLTIAEAGDIALYAEPGQQEIGARAAALRARAVVAESLPEPTLRVGLNNYPFESGGFTTEGMTNAGLGVRQVFPGGDSRALASRQLGLSADAMHANADTRGRNVLTRTRVAWLDVYYWQQVSGLVADSRAYFDDLLTVTRSLYSVGRKSQQDVLRAQLELSRLEDRMLEIERQRVVAKSVLSEWVGEHAERPIAEQLPHWYALPPIEELQQSLTNHPAVAASDAKLAATDAGVDLADERSKPDWALDVGYSYRNGSLPSGEPRSDFISVNVSVGMPFFRRDSVDSSLTAALHDRSAARSSKQKLVRELESNLRAEFAAFHELGRRLALYESQILGQSTNHAEAALLAYQSDKADFADVMRAYVDDLDTNIEFIKLQVERAQTYAAVANLGGLPQ